MRLKIRLNFSVWIVKMKRLRELENGQCLMQDLYGRVGVVQIQPLFSDLFNAFDTRPPVNTDKKSAKTKRENKAYDM